MVTVVEALQGTEKVFSLEVTPPDKGRSIDGLYNVIDLLMKYRPRFVNVTYHQPHVEYLEENGRIVRRPRRKKPGTVGVCSAIHHRFGVETVPHLICGGFSRYETEDALIDLHYLGFRNIFAVRGDPAPGYRRFMPEKEGYAHASQLIEQITAMNQGRYLEPLEDSVATEFCVGCAAYPERHFESPNAEKDLKNLKEKVDKGASYIITQMFFDIGVYRQFVQRARNAGITVPILPGLKPIVSPRQLAELPSTFHVSIPDALVAGLEEARTRDAAFDFGVTFMADLARQLLEEGAPGIHLFTMGKGRSARGVLERVFA